MGETAPFWRFSAASYPDLQGTNGNASKQVIEKHTNGKLNGVAGVRVHIVLCFLHLCGMDVVNKNQYHPCIEEFHKITICVQGGLTAN